MGAAIIRSMSSDLPPPSSPVPPPPGDPSVPGSSAAPRAARGPSRPPGLRSQFGMTRDAAWNLLMAHVDLAKAEAAAIGGQIAGVIGLVVLALALAFFAVVLLVVGTSLFLAHWLLGSMGW